MRDRRAEDPTNPDPVHRAADHHGGVLHTLFLCGYFSNVEFRREMHTFESDISCSARSTPARSRQNVDGAASLILRHNPRSWLAETTSANSCRPASNCSMGDRKAAFETGTHISVHLRPFGVERILPRFSSTPKNCEHQQQCPYSQTGRAVLEDRSQHRIDRANDPASA